MKNVHINEEACIGCGACQAIAPAIFELNNSGIATVLSTSTISEETLSDVMDAIEGCPTGAIVEGLKEA